MELTVVLPEDARGPVPVMIMFRGGREVARQPGAMGAADITRWITAQC